MNQLTYDGNENHQCDSGNGAYNFDMGGHPVRLCVFPKGVTGDDPPFANLTLYNGSHEGANPVIAHLDMFSDHPFLAEVMEFHDAVFKAERTDADAVIDVLVPLEQRLVEGLIIYAHLVGADQTEAA